MSIFHFCLSAAKNLSSFQLLPASLITDLLQLFFGLPLFLFPWGFQCRAAYRSFILFTTYFTLFTPTFSSQQSEVTAAVVFSFETITRHLPPLGATANVELLSLTNLTFSCDFLFPRQKDDMNKISSSQLWLNHTKQNERQVPRRPSCRKTTKGSLQKCQSDTLPSLQKALSVIYDPAVRESNYPSKWLIPPNYSDTLEESYIYARTNV